MKSAPAQNDPAVERQLKALERGYNEVSEAYVIPRHPVCWREGDHSVCRVPKRKEENDGDR
jgi:hypothetical protein